VVRERFADHDIVDADRLDRAIELTRFPVPEDNDAETDTEAGLLRAADLIGQLAHPLYPRKLNAPFAETGLNERLGYVTPADLGERYPAFLVARISAMR
jgi:hypothetical protein